MREYYLTIPGFENYEVSNFGNVRNKRTGRVLHQTLNKEGGYYRVNIVSIEMNVRYVQQPILMIGSAQMVKFRPVL